jgi:hypothetical protein
MASENQISIQISPEDLKKALEAVNTLDAIMKKYLIALSPEERQKKPKMGEKTVNFVEKVSEYALSNPELVPPYMKVEDLIIDFKAVSDLTSIFRPTEQLSSGLNDTMLLCGSEAYTNALIFYNYIKQAAKDNVPNAKTIYEDLKKRFEKLPKKKA